MKKMLITGGSGFLGRRIAEYYKNDYQTLSPTHRALDITAPDEIADFFREYRPDIVIHCAAISDVGRCEREPEAAHRINVEGSTAIAEVAAHYNAKCILCSSDQVYFGSTAPGPHRENESLQPCNCYGQGKKEAEERCLSVNADCVLLRLSWMYDMQTLSATEHGDFIRTLMPRLHSEEPLRYPVYDRRGITDVREVIANLEKTLSLPGGVYNFGAPNDLNTYETVCEAFRAVGLDSARIAPDMGAFAANPRDITMCQEKINAHGIHFSSTEQGLASILQELSGRLQK